MKKNDIQVYLNKKQIDFSAAPQPTRTWIGGRGSGKSVVLGVSQRQKIGDLPRAKFFFAAPTYNHILTKTLAPIISIWEKFGLFEHIPGQQLGCYVIGKQPPKDWAKPYNQVRKYTNVITFYNGYTIEMLSMDRPELARGGSYDGGAADECASLKKQVFSDVLIPSIRANTHKFRIKRKVAHWSHQQLDLVSSMPWKAEGMWLLDYEDKAKLQPDKYYYLESTALDNVHVLGQKSIDRMRDDMTHASFQIEVMNMRHGKSDICFYYNFIDEKHLYKPKFLYIEDDDGIHTKGLQDVEDSKAFDLTFDFGGWFTGLLMFQEKQNTEYMRDSFYVPENKGISHLIDAMCTKYANHKNKYVRIWGEPRGHNKQATGYTYYEEVASRLQRHGWGCDIMVGTAPPESHEFRYDFVNQILAEDNMLYPRLRINEETCKDVVISIHNAEVKADFTKDKKNEKNRSFNQAHATHFTDMLDYFFTQKHGYKLHMYGVSVMPGSVDFR